MILKTKKNNAQRQKWDDPLPGVKLLIFVDAERALTTVDPFPWI